MQEQRAIQQVPLNKIISSRFQTRTFFDPEYIRGLAQSIKKIGQQNPVKLRPMGDRFELVHGECRTKALALIGWPTVKATIEDMPDEQQLAEGLAENIQRADIDALSEAKGINLMHTKMALAVPAIAEKLGKSETYINNRLRLLTLPFKVQEMLLRELLTPTAALHILRCKEPQDKELVAAQTDKFHLTADGVGQLVDTLNKLHDMPPDDPEVKARVIEQPDVVFPCGSCEQRFAKHQLTTFTICPECSKELWDVVLKIRQRRQRAQAGTEQPPSVPVVPVQ